MVLRLGAFGLICWDRGGIHAVADACDDASDDELRRRVVAFEGCDLDDGSENHGAGADDYAFAAAECVAKDEHDYGAEEAWVLRLVDVWIDGGEMRTSDLVDCGYEALPC